MPSSNSLSPDTLSRPLSIDLTPQESEQLSEYVSNDQYVQKQKEDIQELSEIFRTLLGDDEDPMSSSDPYIRAFSSHFHGIPDISVRFTLEITDEDRCLYITADGDILHCTYKQPKNFEPHVTTQNLHTPLFACLTVVSKEEVSPHLQSHTQVLLPHGMHPVS